MSEVILRASSVRSFFETPSAWYKQHITKEEQFTGNTMTVLGTICHYYAECYFKDNEEFDAETILSEYDEDIDKEYIRETYPDMCKVLEEEYLDKIEKPDYIELYNAIEVGNIRFQGTCDSISGTTMVDIKTTGKKLSKIDDYIDQLNIYAYLVSQKDIYIDTLRVVNLIRPTKTLPARLNVLECEADIDSGKYLVDLMIEKANLALRNPEYAHLIFSDNPYATFSPPRGIETKVIDLGE